MASTERILGFDTIVAISALVISTVTAGAMVYQTRVLEKQFAAANWPYISVGNERTNTTFRIDVTNNGAGPALIRSAQLILDGKPAYGWSPLLESVIRAALARHEHVALSADSASIDASVTLRPGDSRTLLSVRGSRQTIDAIRSHRMKVNLCYCSLNDTCWYLSTRVNSLGIDLPQPTGTCNVGSAIEPVNIK